MNTESQDQPEPIELKVNPQGTESAARQTATVQQATGEKSPVIGWIAVGCGVIGLFTMSIIFVPLALICSLIALFMGQILWAFFGFVLAVIGFLTSPILLGIAGLGALAMYFGF